MTIERHRPDVPAWAESPTSPWSKVPSPRPGSEEENADDQQAVQRPGPFPPRAGQRGNGQTPPGYRRNESPPAGPAAPGQPGYAQAPGHPQQYGQPAYPPPGQPQHPGQPGHPHPGQPYGQPAPGQPMPVAGQHPVPGPNGPGQQPAAGQPPMAKPVAGQPYGQPVSPGQPVAGPPGQPGQPGMPHAGQPGQPAAPGHPGMPHAGAPYSSPMPGQPVAAAGVPVAGAAPTAGAKRRHRHAADATGEMSAVPATEAPTSAAPAPVSAAPVSASPTSAAPVSPAAVATPDTVLPSNVPATGAATALSAPTMMHPLVRPKTLADVTTAEAAPPAAEEPEDAPEEVEESEESKTPDPEQELAAIEWRFHHETLRELVDDADLLREIRDRLTEKLTPANDNPTRARLLSLRAVVSRILGDLSKALSDAKMALMHAEATGELRRIAIAQARLAHVLQWRGDFAEADQLFAEANSPELPDRLRATMHEHAGKSCYDQGRYIEACNHFEKALELRKVEDPDLMTRTEIALDAVFRKVAENGWGPYPRTRDEILRIHKPPLPKFDEKKQCWGYVDPSGTTGIDPAFADVQPFRDGVAWVRRPEAETWELIDESGLKLIDASAGWLGVGSFSEGMAWVSRDGHSGWVAIDKKNRVVIPGGFDDVRPFRRGVAAVRRGGWGAVDKTGRVVVPCQFAGFATALTDGRYVDGFTDEGLAIVDNGGRKGVVDKSGKMVVPPVHPALVIHPVAFLVASPSGKWGALDRLGRPLIDPELGSRTAVIEELDRLMSDSKPVL